MKTTMILTYLTLATRANHSEDYSIISDEAMVSLSNDKVRMNFNSKPWQHFKDILTIISEIEGADIIGLVEQAIIERCAGLFEGVVIQYVGKDNLTHYLIVNFF